MFFETNKQTLLINLINLSKAIRRGPLISTFNRVLDADANNRFISSFAGDSQLANELIKCLSHAPHYI